MPGEYLDPSQWPLWMQSGQQPTPPPAPYQQGDLRAGMPPVQPTGLLDSLKSMFAPQRDAQGIPQAPGVGNFLNAAMWALPGARGPRAVMAAEKGGGGPPETLGGPRPGDTYNAVANMAATGDASSLVAHANKFNIPNEQIKSSILQAYDNHKPTATSAYNRFLSARGVAPGGK